eukprot:1621085-Rhodomonas_salina.4
MENKRPGFHRVVSGGGQGVRDSVRPIVVVATVGHERVRAFARGDKVGDEVHALSEAGSDNEHSQPVVAQTLAQPCTHVSSVLKFA